MPSKDGIVQKNMKRKSSTTAPQRKKFKKTKKTKAQLLKSVIPTNNIQWFDTVVTSANVPALTGYAINVSSPTRGSGESQYVGSQIIPLAVEVRGQSIVADTFNIMRVSLIQFVNFPQVTVGIGDVYQYPSIPSTPFTFKNKENIIVLRDEFYRQSQIEDYAYVFHWYVKKNKMLPIQFDGSGAQTGGAMYMVAMSDSGAVSHPVLTFSLRLYYVTK